MIVKSPNGFPVQSPYLSVANKALAQMSKLLVDFGLSPASGARINSPTDDSDDDEFLPGPRPA